MLPAWLKRGFDGDSAGEPARHIESESESEPEGALAWGREDPGPAGKTGVHPQALIDARARIHPTAAIGPFAVIEADVEIGPGTRIGPHVVIRTGTRIGRNNKIFQFASLGDEPQDKKFAGEPSELIIGDRNVIRENVTMHRGTAGGGRLTRIGNDNFFMAYTHVAHDCEVGDQTIFANCASLAGHVRIGDFVVLGGFSGVHQFTRVGAHAFAGMGTMINRDVPPYVTVSGNYAKAYGINKEGLRRRGFPAEVIQALHRAYLVLVKSRTRRDRALAQIAPLARRHPEVATMVAFIRSSERGIVR